MAICNKSVVDVIACMTLQSSYPLEITVFSRLNVAPLPRLFQNRQFRPGNFSRLAFNRGQAINWQTTAYSLNEIDFGYPVARTLIAKLVRMKAKCV